MGRSFRLFNQTVAIVVTIVALTAPTLAEDIAGSADHPLVGRFEGSSIVAYDVRDFDEYDFANEPAASRDPENFDAVEGTVTRIAYSLEGDQSLAEVTRNFEIGMEKNGFEIVFKCETKDCGGGNFAYAQDTFPLPKMVVDPFNFRYIGARNAVEASEVYVAILVSVDANKKIRTQVTVVETDKLEFKIVDAKAMQDAFAEKGSVALYGIYFDTDKADIKPESAPTLEQMAKFLDSAPDLSVVIVGHTDNQGSMEYNLELSHRRAQSVVDALAGSYGIAKDRMVAAGAGFLAPVSPNDTADGRAQNRRVEMIPR